MTFTPFTYLTTLLFTTVIMLLLNSWIIKSNKITRCSPHLALVLLLIPFIKLCFLVEFPFTYIVRSYKILPSILHCFSKKRFHLLVFHISFGDIFFVLWIIGAILTILYQLKRYFSITACFRHFSSTTNERILKIYDSILNTIFTEHSRRECTNPRIILTSVINEPIIYGLFHPTILIPEQEFTDTELKYIITHELYHYIHKDLIWKWVLEAICAIHWWFPPARLLRVQIYHLMEIYADNAVLQNADKQEHVAYLSTLLKVLKNMQTTQLPLPALTLFYFRGDMFFMKRRFIYIKDMIDKPAKEITNIKIILILSIIMVSSFSIVLQPYMNLDKAEECITFNENNYYLVPNDSGDGYKLFNNDLYIGTMSQLHDEMEDLPIFSNKN